MFTEKTIVQNPVPHTAFCKCVLGLSDTNRVWVFSLFRPNDIKIYVLISQSLQNVFQYNLLPRQYILGVCNVMLIRVDIKSVEDSMAPALKNKVMVDLVASFVTDALY